MQELTALHIIWDEGRQEIRHQQSYRSEIICYDIWYVLIYVYCTYLIISVWLQSKIFSIIDIWSSIIIIIYQHWHIAHHRAAILKRCEWNQKGQWLSVGCHQLTTSWCSWWVKTRCHKIMDGQLLKVTIKIPISLYIYISISMLKKKMWIGNFDPTATWWFPGPGISFRPGTSCEHCSHTFAMIFQHLGRWEQNLGTVGILQYSPVMLSKMSKLE